MFDDTLLQRHFQLITIDRLGYNHSKHKHKRFVTSIETHACAALMALTLNRSQQKGVLLGRSYGAPIAAQMAILNPEKFGQLIMLASAIDPDLEKFWWFSKPAKWWVFRMWLPRRLNIASFEKFAHVAELTKLKSQWPQIKMPTTFLQGGKDWIVAPANLDYARRQMSHNPNAHFILLPEAGHLLSKSHPELVRQLIIDSKTAKLSNSKQ